jgi:hypothetical protein
VDQATNFDLSGVVAARRCKYPFATYLLLQTYVEKGFFTPSCRKKELNRAKFHDAITGAAGEVVSLGPPMAQRVTHGFVIWIRKDRQVDKQADKQVNERVDKQANE